MTKVHYVRIRGLRMGRAYHRAEVIPHGRGLARMRVRAPLFQSKAGERTNDCLGEHGI
jgi:hypothetical protein